MTPSQLMTAILAQARAELTLTLRRGESVLVTLIIPLGMFVFFASVKILPPPGHQIGFLLTGTLVLSVISTSLVSLGIATAYERYYGVLKQLGATPLPRSGLVLAKLLAVVALETVQATLLVVMAVLLYGWRPAGAPAIAVLALLLGTSAFAGLGLAMAGALRAEATLGAANGLFLFFMLLGGLFVPLDHLPSWLTSLARVLPAFPLADVLRAALGPHPAISTASAVALVAWSIAAPLLATRTFRWE